MQAEIRFVKEEVEQLEGEIEIKDVKSNERVKIRVFDEFGWLLGRDYEIERESEEGWIGYLWFGRQGEDKRWD